MAHHLGQGLGGSQQVGLGIVPLKGQVDAGQDLLLSDLVQGVGNGARDGQTLLVVVVTAHGGQVADGQVGQRHGHWTGRAEEQQK